MDVLRSVTNVLRNTMPEMQCDIHTVSLGNILWGDVKNLCLEVASGSVSTDYPGALPPFPLHGFIVQCLGTEISDLFIIIIIATHSPCSSFCLGGLQV
jgi:hypothetical protein